MTELDKTPDKAQGAEQGAASGGSTRWLPATVVFIVLAGLIFAVTSLRTGAGADPCDTVADMERVAPEQLPAGLGRGYPTVCLAENDGGTAALAAGAPAPDFHMVLDAQNGPRQLSLESLQGRPVFINFWASWCGPCRQEMPDIVRAVGEYDDLVVLAVNVQEEAAAYEAFVQEFGMEMPVVLDPQGELRRLYGVRNMPTSVFIHRDGTVATVWAGLLNADKLREFIGQIL